MRAADDVSDLVWALTISEVHHLSLALIITGHDLEPDVATSALGWQPNKSYRRGERKQIIRPDGTARVFDSAHNQGGWKLLSSDDEHDWPLQDQVEHWLKKLKEKKREL